MLKFSSKAMSALKAVRTLWVSTPCLGNQNFPRLDLYSNTSTIIVHLCSSVSATLCLFDVCR